MDGMFLGLLMRGRPHTVFRWHTHGSVQRALPSDGKQQATHTTVSMTLWTGVSPNGRRIAEKYLNV